MLVLRRKDTKGFHGAGSSPHVLTECASSKAITFVLPCTTSRVTRGSHREALTEFFTAPGLWKDQQRPTMSWSWEWAASAKMTKTSSSSAQSSLMDPTLWGSSFRHRSLSFCSRSSFWRSSLQSARVLRFFGIRLLFISGLPAPRLAFAPLVPPSRKRCRTSDHQRKSLKAPCLCAPSTPQSGPESFPADANRASVELVRVMSLPSCIADCGLSLGDTSLPTSTWWFKGALEIAAAKTRISPRVSDVQIVQYYASARCTSTLEIPQQSTTACASQLCCCCPEGQLVGSIARPSASPPAGLSFLSVVCRFPAPSNMEAQINKGLGRTAEFRKKFGC